MIDILKYIWQIPQNILALLYLWYLSKENQIPAITEYEGVKVYTKYSSGSISLGDKIFISPRATRITIMHEWGHHRQSLMLGPLYLIIIGVPSILWAMLHRILAPNKSYYWFYTERWANKLAGIDLK